MTPDLSTAESSAAQALRDALGRLSHVSVTGGLAKVLDVALDGMGGTQRAMVAELGEAITEAARR